MILCPDEAHARKALDMVRTWTEQAGTTLHPVKTRLVDLNRPGGFDFLGYHVATMTKHWPRKKSLDHFRDTIPFTVDGPPAFSSHS